MTDISGTLHFRILKQRATKEAGDTGGDDVPINHLIKPVLDINYKNKEFKAECDGDMIDDDTGEPINFCKDKFSFTIEEG